LITIYANGFIIGQGEFRDVKEAKNKQFLEDLKRGEVPDELNALCMKEWPGAGDVAVSLIDKSAETFVPPKPKFSFASSQGQSLGAGAAAAAGASAAASAQAFAGATPQRLQVDPSQPTTTLQLVLGGRKVKETANQSATVLQLYQHFMRYEFAIPPVQTTPRPSSARPTSMRGLPLRITAWGFALGALDGRHSCAQLSLVLCCLLCRLCCSSCRCSSRAPFPHCCLFPTRAVCLVCLASSSLPVSLRSR
jgi:hypothetical protein